MKLFITMLFLILSLSVAAEKSDSITRSVTLVDQNDAAIPKLDGHYKYEFLKNDSIQLDQKIDTVVFTSEKAKLKLHHGRIKIKKSIDFQDLVIQLVHAKNPKDKPTQLTFYLSEMKGKSTSAYVVVQDKMIFVDEESADFIKVKNKLIKILKVCNSRNGNKEIRLPQKISDEILKIMNPTILQETLKNLKSAY